MTGIEGHSKVDVEIQNNGNALSSLRKTLVKIPNIGGYRALYGHFMKPNKASSGGTRTSVLPENLRPTICATCKMCCSNNDT